MSQRITSQPNVTPLAQHPDRVPVIIMLEGNALSEVSGGMLERLSQQITLAVVQSVLIQTLQQAPYNADQIRATQFVLNSVMAVVNWDSIPALQQLPNVRSVAVDQQMTRDNGGVGRVNPDDNTIRQPVERPTTVNE